MLDETVKMVRRIASELRPSLLDHMGLGPAIQWHLKEFEKKSAIYTVFDSSMTEASLSDKIKINLFRIVQESLTNVARHSLAKSAMVSLQQNELELKLTIQDNGVGFDTQETAAKETLGILGMKERTAMIGGTYEITSIPGQGTTIIVKIKKQ
jgi:signal transduction histidine kinase